MNRIFWIVAIVVVVAVVIVYFQWKPTPSANAPSAGAPSQAVVPAAPSVPSQAAQLQASGDSDAIVNKILNDTTQLAPTPSEADPSLVAPSDAVMNSFDQSLNANQF